MSQVQMRRAVLALLGVLLTLAACQPTPTPEIPRVAVLPTATQTDTPVPPTVTPVVTPTVTLTPSLTLTPSSTWTPYIIIATYTPSITYTPSLTYTPSNTPTPTNTFTPSPPPTFTPTQDQPAPVVVAVAPDVPGLVTPRDPRCLPTTTTITANIESSVGLYTLRLNYVYNTQPGQVILMVNQEGNLYTAELGPFDQPGQVAYWLSMADNWGKWVTTDPQQITIAECDVDALNATAAAAATNALTATALAVFGGGGNPLAFRAADFDLTTPYQTPIRVTFAAVNGTPPYRFLINSNPANGRLIVLDAQTVEYRPNAGFLGNDTFTYLASDSSGQSDVGIVRVTVGSNPLEAVSQTISVPLDAVNFPITLQARNGVPPYTTVTIVTSPAQGTLTPDGIDPFKFYYTPPAGFTGTTQFVWSVTDSSPAYAQGTITLNVTPPPPGGKIVFASNSSGNWEIYTMNADGSGITNVSNAPASDERQPALSPDGSRIAFMSNRDGNANIYVMNVDGSGVTALTADPATDSQPAWSPDGNFIAFVSDRNDSAEIWRMQASGASPTRLTSNFVSDQHPTYSPDGQRIAFQRDGGGSTQIYSIRASDGGGEQQLTSSGANVEPDWGANGRIVFASNRDGGSFDIFVMNGDGSGQARLVNSPPNRWPAWSGDANWVVYYRDNGGSWAVYRAWRDGSGETLLASGGLEPDW
ncbi:MAG: DUF5050 domain-containing protein [Anaerolineae bacterium]|nr:DUF5050 domain-containing protein [Anaerolineae bacterium]